MFLETRALGIDSKEYFQKRIENWKLYLLSILPNKVRFTMLPVYLNYIFDNSISTYISDHCCDFLYVFFILLLAYKKKRNVYNMC